MRGASSAVRSRGSPGGSRRGRYGVRRRCGDEAAVAVARNPAALIRALEHLAEDPQVPGRVTAGTAPLWVAAPGTDFTDRIAKLRRAAGLPVE